PDGATVRRAALRIAKPIARLKQRAHAAQIPVIYVNDTAGKWESDQQAFVDRCLRGKGREIAELLRPAQDDYFMFKPKHSAFYGTPLEELLGMLKVQRLVLTGTTSHQCVLFTASDAHVRELAATVATDCVAAATAEETRHALFIYRRALQAQVVRSTSISF
ncbi:MAG: isochorismatase family cysteine hydrolase, partial [Steroidobacteraceae bacterium]